MQVTWIPVAGVSVSCRYRFDQGDIVDPDLVAKSLEDFKPDVIVNVAAESHVDSSIDGRAESVQTDVVGTRNLLQSARN